MFLNDQLLAGLAKKTAKLAKEVSQQRCWGRGLWEVASLTSLLPKPILMKDVRQDGLDLGMSEARKLLNKSQSDAWLKHDSSVKHYPNWITVVLTRLILWSRRWSKILTLKSTVLQGWSNWYGMTPSYRPTPLISVDDLSSVLARPETLRDALFNPVPVMPLLGYPRRGQQ